MLSSAMTKILNLFNFVLLNILLIPLSFRSVKPNERTLLLIRLDAIGDYILFRNFIEAIKNSRRYKGYHITLCGNIAWKDLAECFDKNYIDEFIWINRKKFYWNLLDKFKILSQIRERGFETVIEATYSREILFGDAIVKAANGSISIGSVGSREKHVVWKRKLLTSRYYSTLIDISDPDQFEFETNKEFFSKILGEEIRVRTPRLNIPTSAKPDTARKRYVVLFPGTKERMRMWSSSNFKEIANFLLVNYPFDIALSGSKQEGYLFDQIVSIPGERFSNYFGNSLTQLAALIAGAELVISNDTSAVHFAAAVGTPFLCISNGSYFGRFQPYPKEIFGKGYYIYPPEIMDGKASTAELKEWYRFGSSCDINSVKPDAVKVLINKILSV